MPSLDVVVIPVLKDNYSYLLVHGKAAAVVDPAEARPVARELKKRGLALSQILLTHHHGDHIEGAAELARPAKCPVIGPADPRIPGLTRTVGQGDTVAVGDAVMDVIAVPGHTRTHIAFHAPREGLLFCGDTLFVGSCGFVFEGTPEIMLASLAKLAKLPGATRLYCGHEYAIDCLEYAAKLEPGNPRVAARLRAVRDARAAGQPSVPSTIEWELQSNPFLRCADPALRRILDMPKASDAEVFTEIRRREDL